MTSSRQVEAFIREQLADWQQAADNYAALMKVHIKDLYVNGMHIKVQFNPARIVSSAAKIDTASLKERKCFLCDENRPTEQHSMPWGERYNILVNPFPIFTRHLTIPERTHTRQLISGRLADMLQLAAELDGYTVFYNGPYCGASAPDHMHFQAGNSDFLTLVENLSGAKFEVVVKDGASSLSLVDSLPQKLFVIDASTVEEGVRLFEHLYAALPIAESELEPMMNILCYATAKGVRLVVIPRKRHRPSFYGVEGEDRMLLSPGAVDMGGVFITPRLEDYERLDADVVRRVFEELCLSSEEAWQIAAKIKGEPSINVGIVSGSEINVFLKGNYTTAKGIFSGAQTFALRNGKVLWHGEGHACVELNPCTAEDSFDVRNVTIGVNFHWERQETQSFLGALRIIVEDDKLTLINALSVENYLSSVISSEMSATASAEFLKAHAVISRSWLLAQIDKRTIVREAKEYNSHTVTEDEIIRWYNREDHANFDVCADDHCQRYQGITRQTTPTVREVIAATRGLVLVDKDSNLCDTRFSKCCGGTFEEFENCWEPTHYHYLEAQRDGGESELLNLSQEDEARRWIMSRPQAYCNTNSATILSQVLNNYDQETTDFYRWTVSYSQDELASLIRERSGIDFGGIVALEPLERGTSGRIIRLRIVGTRRTMIIGKELEIRRTLSTSHLYSSAFVVETGDKNAEGLPVSFRLYGAGWGHGVGLCQIGAAVMGANGYDFKSILMHYFKGATLKKLY